MNKINKAKIIKILPGSIADNFNIEPGDYLLSVDGNNLKDFLDYQFAISDTETLELKIEKHSGNIQNILIKKKPSEDLGIIFESAVFDSIKICNNKCIFCFVDQQPQGLRDTLYVKDDDYRLSYLQGTYITLTNLTKSDIKRIEQLRLGPLYISVHTTNPDLRIRMLNNKLAGNIKEKLQWLQDLFIPVHTQIVVCPGFNNGIELEQTLSDLSNFDNVLSVAIVPVGITAYRKDTLLKPFTKEIALETINLVNKVNTLKEDSFAFPSDEIYMLAGLEIPSESFYKDFEQLEDGVGVSRLTLDQFYSMQLPSKIKNPHHIGIITASLAAKILKPAFDTLGNIENLKLTIIEIDNKFWGNTVSVCGLIVGQDVISTLETLNSVPEEIFLPSVMLRKFTDEFIDGIKVKDIEKRFNTQISIIENHYSFEELVQTLKNKS